MGISQTTLPASPSSEKGFSRPWHSPTLTVTRFILRSYTKSGWILGNIVFVWLLYAIFYAQFGGNVAYFFGTANPGVAVLAILGTIVMTQRAVNARMYLPLARLTSRRAYVRGLIIATSALVIPAYLLLMILAMSYHRFSPPPCGPTCIEGATLANMLLGSLGLLLNCIIAVILTVLLSRPIATRLLQILFLVWLLVTLYSNSSIGALAQYIAWVRLPLAPLIVCANLSTSTFGWYEGLMLLVALGYIFGLSLLAQYLFSRRDLILH